MQPYHYLQARRGKTRPPRIKGKIPGGHVATVCKVVPAGTNRLKVFWVIFRRGQATVLVYLCDNGRTEAPCPTPARLTVPLFLRGSPYHLISFRQVLFQLQVRSKFASFLPHPVCTFTHAVYHFVAFSPRLQRGVTSLTSNPCSLVPLCREHFVLLCQEQFIDGFAGYQTPLDPFHFTTIVCGQTSNCSGYDVADQATIVDISSMVIKLFNVSFLSALSWGNLENIFFSLIFFNFAAKLPPIQFLKDSLNNNNL